MSSKGLSSRLQGLKFMQRASARDELKDTKPNPASSKANFPAEGVSGDETEAKDVSRNAEHWVVPVNMRVKTKSAQRDTSNWDSWFQKATETDFVPARQQFGSWKGRRNQGDDEFEEDVSDNDEESYDDDDDDDDDESFSSAPSSPADKGFLKPPSAPQSSQPAQKRRASSTWDEPSRSKLAAVADKSQGLRKKKLR